MLSFIDYLIRLSKEPGSLRFSLILISRIKTLFSSLSGVFRPERAVDLPGGFRGASPGHNEQRTDDSGAERFHARDFSGIFSSYNAQNITCAWKHVASIVHVLAHLYIPICNEKGSKYKQLVLVLLRIRCVRCTNYKQPQYNLEIVRFFYKNSNSITDRHFVICPTGLRQLPARRLREGVKLHWLDQGEHQGLMIETS